MFDNSTNKFQLGLVYLFAILAVIGIGPFVYLRYAQGEITHALLDLAIVCAAIGSAVYARWRGEATAAILNFAAGFYTLGAIVVVHLNSPIFVFWIFPTVLANFFLLRPKRAIILNLIAIALVVPVAWRLGKTLDSLAMMSSLFFGSTMAYLFARLTEEQRLRLEIFASQDPLTMLGNRRLMDEELRLCTDDFARYKIPATLIVFDLDKFKDINDKFGHSIGDQVLINIGNLLSARLRKTDRAFRFGGEEFVLLARNTRLDEAAIIAEQIRVQITTHINGPKGTISASFGCASIQPEETREQWFVRADRAMYEAKEQGRNCVVLAEE
ncbi:GGDEF domain-containing protein [Cellvibrio zantedeschiae]|uniref:diguanylate cyclase n=1 Tax=Cellvibrio zantedeschiae TaxID=1237077 RepID=A0ABQ3B2R3_9GAMM|nr:GGDEF domain-containing protein [Cellvibrio zantedeschiae]GGY75339.1 GGDEF domain-containing protein [Cellvibrio zantedeschiae]